MSGVLSPFTNQLSELDTLKTEMKWRGDWLVTTQYFQFDVVRSPLTGVEYVLNGKTTLRGGVDPSASTTTDWISLGGIQNTSLVPTIVAAGAPNYTVTGGNLLNAPANSRWLVVFQGIKTLVGGANNTSADVDSVLWSAPGGDAFAVNLQPDLSVPATGVSAVSCSGVIETNAVGNITMTAQYYGVASTWTAVKVSYIRII